MTENDNPAAIRMVAVTAKDETPREAVATCSIRLMPETLKRLVAGDLEKGNPLEVARVAAVLGAKKTPGPRAALSPDRNRRCRNPLHNAFRFHRHNRDGPDEGSHGCREEALVAAAAAALTIYDMVKSIGRAAEISNLRLLSKSGGRSGSWRRKPDRADGNERPPP